ncbi:phage tail tape measure protein [Bacteroides sp.]|uniref:phage tail tape measure protein n=1 Tax=Bacteroides sp. TaxID=29523 RepID=UPI00262C3719|nr:phage tail tape measure protein [Bacteroides sp.]MDD3038605.1 phage tail tape measure protein [Bacteroides sp.]
MARLYFRIESDWQIVVKTREEVARFEKQLLSMNKNLHPEAVAELEKQLAAAKQKLSGLVTEAAKAAVVFENDLKKGIYDGEKAVNSLSEEIIKQNKIIRETQNDVSVLAEQYKKLGKYDPKRQSLSDELNRAKSALKEQKYALGELRSEQSLAKLSTKALKDEYALYKDESKGIVTVNEGIGTSFKKVLATMGGVALLKQVASNVVSTAGMFQKYESVLTNALNGSSDKAKAYLSDINSFAAKTNFQLNELTDDFIKFVNRGVTPSMDAMKKLGDFTNTVAKPFDQLTEAILDVNNSERWKEFGVRVQTEGNKIKLSFRDMTVECDRTVESVMKAVEQFGSMKGVEGSTEAIAKTIEGQMSNFEDTITTALAEIGLANQDLISGSISTADTIVKNYGIIGKSVLTLIEIYGVYRAGLLINTIVEHGSVKSIWAKITATKAATIAQAAYNKVLAMNPYVAVGMAVVSLGIAMWTLADNTSEAEKAQKRFNERQEEAVKREQEHKQKIDDLINSSRDIALADLQRGQSLAELRKEYSKIFAQYDIETIKLADILKLKQQIAEEDEKRAGEKRAKEFSDIESEIKYYENLLKSLSGQQGVDGYVKKLKELRADRDVILQENGKGISEQFIANLKNIDISELDRYIIELERRIKGMGANGKVKMKLPIDVKGTLSGEAIYDAKDIKTLIDTAKSSKANRIKTASEKTTYKQDYEQAKKDWEKAKKTLSEIEKDKSKFTSKQYEDAKKRSETSEKVYKDLGGITGSSLTKQDSAAEKLRKQKESIREQNEKIAEMDRKQAIDRQRQQEDLENQATQAGIDARADGFDKKQRQRNLDNNKEIQALERQKEDYIRAFIQGEKEKFDAQEELNAKNIKGYNKNTFDSSTVKVDTSIFDGIIGNTSKRQLNDKIREQEDAWNEYLIKFGSYQQKRKAIIEKYDKEIREAQTAGDAATLEKNKQNAIDELDNSIKNSATLMGQLFADASQKSTNEIQKVIEKAELLMQYLGSVKDKQGNAQIGGKTVSKKDIIDLGISDNTLQNLKLSTEQVEALRNAINRLKGDLGSKSPFKLFETQIKAAVDKLKLGGKDNIVQGIAEIGRAIAEFSPFVSQFGKDLGNVFGSDDLGNKIAGISDAVGGLGKTATGVGQIMSGDIVGGAMSAVSGISSVVDALDGLFGADYSHYNEMKNQYDVLNSVWDELIDKKKEYIDMSYGPEAEKVGKEAEDLLNKSIESYRTLGRERLNSGASAGSHSIGVRIRKGMSNEGWSQWNSFADSIGMNPNDVGGRMTGLFDLTAKQLEKLKQDAPTFWAKLDGDVQEYLNKIIEGEERIEDIQEQVSEQLTQTTFDSLFNNFIDTLMDMKASSKDAAEDISEMFMRAMLSNQIGGLYQDKLKKWYEKFSENMKDGSLSEDERNALNSEYMQYVEEAMKLRDELAAATGYDKVSQESTSQSSTYKGFETMSQDTGEELNGRFTALQIAGEEIKNQSIAQTQSLNLLTMKADAILSINTETKNIADDTRDLIANSYLELVQISENTGAIIKPIQQMQKDMAEVKKNTSKL